MVCGTFSDADSPIHRLDPRLRLVVALLFSVVIALARHWQVPVAGLFLGLLLAPMARLPRRALLSRLGAVNLFMLFLILVLPFSSRGEELFTVGPLAWNPRGAFLALEVTVKVNGIVLVLTTLVATMETAEVGHAMSRLHVPRKLTHLFLFTARYLDLIHHEYSRLRRAMKVRCFRPGMNRHTYRSLAWLVGMLLVRSFDRSERVVKAMKCRGFDGNFYVLKRFSPGRADALFGIVSLAVILLLAIMEWL